MLRVSIPSESLLNSVAASFQHTELLKWPESPFSGGNLDVSIDESANHRHTLAERSADTISRVAECSLPISESIASEKEFGANRLQSTRLWQACYRHRPCRSTVRAVEDASEDAVVLKKINVTAGGRQFP